LVICAVIQTPVRTQTSRYNFWLDKLNSFNVDFAQAEMVKAFIESDEYRQRSLSDASWRMAPENQGATSVAPCFFSGNLSRFIRR